MSTPHPIVLVTGSTDGIGLETARELTRRGARVLVHGRKPERAEEARRELARLGGDPLEPLLLDLTRLSEVRRAGELLDARGVKVDVLVNNAGVYMNDAQRTVDGFEVTFAVNHLAPFVLTHALLAAHAGATLARIVNVSSMAHARGRLDLDDLSFERRGFDPYGTYAASKLANVLFTVELARRLHGRATVNVLHPGVVSTKLLTEGFKTTGGDSLAEAAATSVRLAVDPDVEGVTGEYWSGGKVKAISAAARDPELARRFYEKSVELTGVAPPAA